MWTVASMTPVYLAPAQELEPSDAYCFFFPWFAVVLSEQMIVRPPFEYVPTALACVFVLFFWRSAFQASCYSQYAPA